MVIPGFRRGAFQSQMEAVAAVRLCLPLFGIVVIDGFEMEHPFVIKKTGFLGEFAIGGGENIFSRIDRAARHLKRCFRKIGFFKTRRRSFHVA